MATLRQAKSLGGVGSILVVLGLVPYAGFVLEIVGFVMILVAVKFIADLLFDRAMFNKMIIAVVLAIVGIVVGFVVVFGALFSLAGLGSIGIFVPGTLSSNYSPYSITRTELLNNVPNVETSIAIDPNNPNYMIVGTTPQYFAPEYSTDGGVTWHNDTAQISAFWGYISPSVGDNPGAAIGPDGTDYSIEYTTLVNGSAAQMFYIASSTNHGQSWTLDPNPYASVITNSTFHAVVTTWTFLNGTTTTGCFTQANTIGGDYQKVAVDDGPTSPFKGYIYIIGDFQILWDGLCVVQQGFIRSADGGRTWGQHIITDPAFAGSSQVESLSIAPNGEIYFSRNYGNTGTASILFEKSADGGNTWSYKVIPTSGVVLNPDTTYSPSGIYIVYISCLTSCNYSTNGSSAVFLKSSTDDGSTWSSPLKISDSAAVPYWSYIANPDPLGNPENCAVTSIFTDCGPVHRPPTITASSLGIVVSWTDWRNSINSTNADIYAYVSSIRGSNVRLTAFPGRLCEFLQGNCNGFGFGNDQMKVASSTNGVFFAVGIDIDNNRASNCSTACTVTDVSVIRINPLGAVGVIRGLLIGLVVIWGFFLIASIFLKKSYDSIAARLHVGMFRTTGLLYLIGAAMTIIFVGLFIVFVAEILQIVTFFSIPDQVPIGPQPIQGQLMPPPTPSTA